MPLLSTLGDARDVVVIVYGIIGVIFFFVGVLVLLGVFFGVRGLVKNINDLLNDSVRPTLGSIKETAETVRGTTEFVGKTAVAPIVRTYGMVAGVKKGLGVLTSFGRGKAK